MYCMKCGSPIPEVAVFCPSCGAVVGEFSEATNSNLNLKAGSQAPPQSISPTVTEKPFRATRQWMFWVYLLFALPDFLTGAIGIYALTVLINLLEITAFIVGFSRARFNWLTVWVYALVGSNLLTWLNESSFYPGEYSVLFVWTVVVGVLVYGYMNLAKRLGVRAWVFDKKRGTW